MDSRRHIWRVQGVPCHVDKEELAAVLSGHPDLQCADNSIEADNSVDIRTLAQAHTGRYQVATLRFRDHPAKIRPGNDTKLTILADFPPATRGVELTFDDDFHGITALFSPVAEEHHIDILVVPGLGSHPFGSFVNKQDGHMWLCDSLVKDVPSARVMVYGYSSGLQASKSAARLGGLARSFQIPMCDLLRSEPKKRLILVAHSLGGLLVKESLIQTLETESESALLDLVHGCVFFGVPNDGMDITSLIPMVEDGPNRLLLQSLENMNPEILRVQKQKFSVVLNQTKLSMFCFYETELSPTAAKDPISNRYKMNGTPCLLLTPASATSCLPADMSLALSAPIARTHSDLVKFGHHDAEYSKVSAQIKQMCLQSAAADTDYKEKVLNSLYFQEMAYRKKQIHDDSADNSYWIWNQADFQAWLGSPRCLFWIKGKPGSGKSTLMKYIQRCKTLKRELSENPGELAWVIVDFFFDFRAGASFANNLEGFFRSLLLQMIKAMPRQAAEVRNFALDSLDPQQNLSWGMDSLRRAVKKVISAADANICIFADGLDEYGGSYLELVQVFRELESEAAQAQIVVKVCFASRPEPLFVESFKTVQNIRMQDHNEPSIRKHVSDKFNIILPQDSEDEEISRLIKQITRNAEGVFLWAQLATEVAIEAIAEGESIAAIEQHLLELPSDLEAIYDRMLHRLKPRQFKEAYLMLSFISHAVIPPTVEMLREALDMTLNVIPSSGGYAASGQVLDETEFKIWTDFAKKIRSCTCGLVEIVGNNDLLENRRGRTAEDPRNGKVVLIHQTVKTFLDQPESLQFLRTRKDEALPNPERLWLEVCTKQLKQEPPRPDGWHLGKFPSSVASLSNYARTAACEHARRLEQTTSESSFRVFDPLLTLLKPESLESLYPVMAFPASRKKSDVIVCSEKTTVLSFAANQGLVRFCRDKIEAGADPNEHEGRALYAAMEGLSEDVVSMLLENGLEVTDGHIIEALGCMHLATIQAMMKGVPELPISLTNHLGATIKPLYAVASTLLPWDGRAEQLVRQFMQRGEDINEFAGPEGTPMHAALRAGFMSDPQTLRRRIEFMIRSGAKLNPEPDPSPLVVTPLDIAFRTFLQHGSNRDRYKMELQFLLHSGGDSRRLSAMETALALPPTPCPTMHDTVAFPRVTGYVE